MKAAIRRIYGGPEKISIEEIEKPNPKEGQILVKVNCTTINRTDTGVLTGRPYIFQFFIGLFSPKRKILGTDFVGEVETINNENSTFKVGDRVMGFLDDGIESQAEYLAVSSSKPIVKIPDGIDYKTAVAGIEGMHYAINFLNKVEYSANQSVMINGGTGAIGSALIQLCKYHGLNVVATCRGQHTKQVLELGADRVINYETQDFTQDQEQFNFVFDAVGKSTFAACKKLLKPKGAYISSELGPGAQNPFLALVTPLFGGKKVKFPLPTHIPKSIEISSDLLATGKFKPLIDDREYQLSEAALGYEYVLSAQKVGNVILNIKQQ